MRRYALPLAALLLALAACTPAAEFSPAPSLETLPVVETSPATPIGSPSVHTDWSKLEPRPVPLPEVGSRWYEGYSAELIPRDDYGELVPYAGLRLMDDWPAADGCMYGLMTKDGLAVTDPVFSTAYRPGDFPLLVLRQGDPTSDQERDRARVAVAAADGSWYTGLEYRLCRWTQEGLLLFQADSLTLMAPDGAILGRYSPDDLGRTREQFDRLIDDVQWGEGVGGQWYGDRLTLGWADDVGEVVWVYQISTARQSTMTYDEWGAYCLSVYKGPSLEEWTVRSVSGETVLTRGEAHHVIPFGVEDGQVEVWGDLVLFYHGGAVYTLDGREILPPEEGAGVNILMENGAAVLLEVSRRSETGPGRMCYYLADGTPVPMLDSWGTPGRYWFHQVSVENGLIEVLDWDTASYYDAKTLACVFRTYLGYDDI